MAGNVKRLSSKVREAMEAGAAEALALYSTPPVIKPAHIPPSVGLSYVPPHLRTNPTPSPVPPSPLPLDQVEVSPDPIKQKKKKKYNRVQRVIIPAFSKRTDSVGVAYGQYDKVSSEWTKTKRDCGGKQLANYLELIVEAIINLYANNPEATSLDISVVCVKGDNLYKVVDKFRRLLIQHQNGETITDFVGILHVRRKQNRKKLETETEMSKLLEALVKINDDIRVNLKPYEGGKNKFIPRQQQALIKAVGQK